MFVNFFDSSRRDGGFFELCWSNKKFKNKLDIDRNENDRINVVLVVNGQ